MIISGRQSIRRAGAHGINQLREARGIPERLETMQFVGIANDRVTLKGVPSTLSLPPVDSASTRSRTASMTGSEGAGDWAAAVNTCAKTVAHRIAKPRLTLLFPR